MTQEPGEDLLRELLCETVEAKQAIQRVLHAAPEDVQLHRIHGMYTGHILDIRKALIQEQAVDKDQLLLEALGTIVRFLIERDETASARLIADHLEEIGMKVKEIWQDSRGLQNLRADTKESAKRSPPRSPPSGGPPPPQN